MGRHSCNYVELATLSVRQPFYANGICRSYQTVPSPDFELVPTSDCLAVMKRLDLMFRRDDYKAGFAVLARVNGGSNELRFPPQKGDALTFWMKLRNPDVLNFNDLPINNGTSLFYYFTNQQSENPPSGTPLHLSLQKEVAGEIDTLESASDIFRFTHPSEVASADATIRHLLTGREISPDSVVNYSGKSALVFLLSAIPPGKCQLVIKGAIVREFYHAGGLTGKAFGVIELSLSDRLPSRFRMVRSGRRLPETYPAYIIQFRSREICWRYTIHPQKHTPLVFHRAATNGGEKKGVPGELNIVAADNSITFVRQTVGDTDLVFISRKTICFHEDYLSATTHSPLNLELVQSKGRGEGVTVIRSYLPYPPTSLIDAGAGKKIYSDVFITL